MRAAPLILAALLIGTATAGIRVGSFQIVPGSCEKVALIVNSQPVTTETCVAVREITVTPDTAKADTTTKNKGPVK